MVNGVATNFLRNLDSACMMETVNLCTKRGITNFHNVHDASVRRLQMFMCLMKRCVMLVKIFQDDVLQDFRDGIEKLIPEKEEVNFHKFLKRKS